MPAEWLGSLRGAVDGEVRTDPAALESAGRDASFVISLPDAVVRPTDAEDLVALVRWARAHRVPLTARGGGTSLDGECVPVDGGVVVDLSGWNAIGAVDPLTRTVRVGPGVINHDLAVALRSTGWFFPPNPGSWKSSTIGGNVATNASGPRSFRYGPTRRWVHAAEVVLGTGERTVLGPTTAKRAVGPELLDLLVGSEGRLALATSVTLRLAPAPERRCGIVVAVPDGVRLGPVAKSLGSRPTLRISAMEYVDGRVAGLLRTRPGARLPGDGPLILLELESDGAPSEDGALAELHTTLRAAGIRDSAAVVPDADRLWSLRGEAGSVLDAETGPRVREDIAVPVDRVDEALAALREVADRAGAELYVYAHLGQGNLHPNVTVDPGSQAGRTVRTEILAVARRLGGTVSGEHGVGSVKRSYVEDELGRPAVEILRGWKALCDPDGVLNPGKLLPSPGRRAPSPGPSPAPGGARRTRRG